MTEWNGKRETSFDCLVSATSDLHKLQMNYRFSRVDPRRSNADRCGDRCAKKLDQVRSFHFEPNWAAREAQRPGPSQAKHLANKSATHRSVDRTTNDETGCRPPDSNKTLRKAPTDWPIRPLCFMAHPDIANRLRFHALSFTECHANYENRRRFGRSCSGKRKTCQSTDCCFVVFCCWFLLISAIFIENKTRQKGGKIRGIFDYERMRNRRVMLASSFQIHSEFHQRALTQRQTSESSQQKKENNRPKHIEIIEADNEIEYR